MTFGYSEKIEDPLGWAGPLTGDPENPSKNPLVVVTPVGNSLKVVTRCEIFGPDGFRDLTPKFDIQDLAQAMGTFLQEGAALKIGGMVALELSGNLLVKWDRAAIGGASCSALLVSISLHSLISA